MASSFRTTQLWLPGRRSQKVLKSRMVNTQLQSSPGCVWTRQRLLFRHHNWSKFKETTPKVSKSYIQPKLLTELRRWDRSTNVDPLTTESRWLEARNLLHSSQPYVVLIRLLFLKCYLGPYRGVPRIKLWNFWGEQTVFKNKISKPVLYSLRFI